MAKKLETKEFPFILTKMDETEGTFEGYASIFDVVDSYGDSVARGAFRKTLRDNPAFHMLWSHLITEPIGIIRGKEDKTGFAVTGKLNTDIQRGKEVRSHMKAALEAGIPMGLSIGYQTMKEDVDRENGTRILKEIKLWEISVCLFQACPGAVIADVKSDDLELKPYPNNHACLIDESLKVVGSQTRKHEGKEYTVRIGKDEDGKTGDHSYLYPKDAWTAAEARAHCKSHGGKFEAATGKCATCGALLEEPGEPTQDGKPQKIDEPVVDHSFKTYAEVVKEFRESIERGKNA